jgi:DNA-binding MarR family transcriptional regulator
MHYFAYKGRRLKYFDTIFTNWALLDKRERGALSNGYNPRAMPYKDNAKAIGPGKPIKPSRRKADTRPVAEQKSPEEIARTLKLDKGLGFLVRLLDTRVNLLYEQLTAQDDITPRQFGVLLTLHQQGTLTLTDLARHIQVDRSTLGEMINRMAVRSLITKRDNGQDRRSAEVLLASAGRKALFRIVTGAAQLQAALLAPLPIEDRAHFMRCMKLVAEPDPAITTDDAPTR